MPTHRQPHPQANPHRHPPKATAAEIAQTREVAADLREFADELDALASKIRPGELIVATIDHAPDDTATSERFTVTISRRRPPQGPIPGSSDEPKERRGQRERSRL